MLFIWKNNELRIPQQTTLQLNKTVDATPEQVKEWEQTDFFRKGDFDVMKLFVVIPALIQIGMFGLMLAVFAFNQALF